MPVKERIGKVVSKKMLQTAIVSVENIITHKKYGKIMSRTKRYAVHDANDSYIVGDIVSIRETRPISKTKRWTIVNLISRLSN